MIEAIRRLKSGKATTRAAHDPIPGLPNGIAIKVEVEVDAEAGTIAVDLRDNPDCQPCGLNLTQGTASTAAMVGIYNAILDHTVPTNAGSFRRITLKLRENCAVGIPRHPFSCSVATTNLADRVANCVQRAIAEIAPGFGLAETGPSQPPGMGVISGLDPRHGNAPFVNQVFIGVTGGAATAASDAFMTIIDIGNAGLCRHDSIEVDELHHPLHIVSRTIVPDTEGAGRYRGAPSMVSEFGPTPGCTMKVLYTSDGTINHAIGVLGGGGGGPSRALKRERDGSSHHAAGLLRRDARARRICRFLFVWRWWLRQADSSAIRRWSCTISQEGWITAERARFRLWRRRRRRRRTGRSGSRRSGDPVAESGLRAAA